MVEVEEIEWSGVQRFMKSIYGSSRQPRHLSELQENIIAFEADVM